MEIACRNAGVSYQVRADRTIQFLLFGYSPNRTGKVLLGAGYAAFEIHRFLGN
jgi:hypothetical protein